MEMNVNGNYPFHYLHFDNLFYWIDVLVFSVRNTVTPCRGGHHSYQLLAVRPVNANKVDRSIRKQL